MENFKGEDWSCRLANPAGKMVFQGRGVGLFDEIRVWNRLFFYQDIFPRDYGILQKMREGDVSHCDRCHMISIIVPVYNGENSIGNCLNSIYTQVILLGCQLMKTILISGGKNLIVKFYFQLLGKEMEFLVILQVIKRG